MADCAIESDMELLLPADYVPQESERIALYRELDNINREMDLMEFQSNLIDRFGKIPPETAELIRVPRLRRLGRQLGIEKSRSSRGLCTSIRRRIEQGLLSEPDVRAPDYLPAAESAAREIREKAGKRSFSIANVPRWRRLSTSSRRFTPSR